MALETVEVGTNVLFSELIATYVAMFVDFLAAGMCILAMQVVVIRIGYIHLQRLSLGFLACCLFVNGASNPNYYWFGDHHLSGFLIDVSILVFLTVFVMRGYKAKREGLPTAEAFKQPGDYIKDAFTSNGLHKNDNGVHKNGNAA